MRPLFFLFLCALFLTSVPAITLATDESCGESEMSCECTDSDGTAVSLNDDSITDGDLCAEACTGKASYAFYCGTSETPLDSGMISSSSGSSPADSEAEDPTIPALNVPIPGLDLAGSVEVDAAGNIKTNMIGLYVNAIFSYGITLAALFGVLMLMIAGFQYMTAGGDKSAVAKAKGRMQNTVFGLILLMATYTIAFLIDPRTTYFNSLTLEYIDPVKYIEESGDVGGGAIGSIDDATLPEGIDCSGSGATALSGIAYASKGKVNYRMGGKIGISPPYQYESKIDSSGQPYSEYCPEGSLCLDCSGYADFLAQCAGLSSLGGSTSEIFSSNAEAVTSCTDTSINGVTMQPGDVVGWKKGDGGQSYGHVFTYIGGGKIADSHGSGRSNGNAVGIYNLSWACDKYATALHVRRR